MKVSIFQLLVVLTLSACASTEEHSAATDPAEPDLDYNGSDCILIRTIRDYTPLDRQHLLIHGPGRRAYFVRLFRPAFDMRSSIGFRVDSRDDQLCPYGGDTIVFGSFADERVPVQSISRLTTEQEEQLLIRYGKKGPAESVTPEQPAEVSGAEVEELG